MDAELDALIARIERTRATVPDSAVVAELRDLRAAVEDLERRVMDPGAYAVHEVAAALGVADDQVTCRDALRCGSVAALKHVHKRRPEWGPEYAVLGGRTPAHVRCLRWAVEHGCPATHVTLASLAESGADLATLEWARLRGMRFSTIFCAAAAATGRVDVLEWAAQHGCEIAPTTCHAAAHHGHLAVVKWLHARGCCLDAELWKIARDRQDIDTLVFLRMHGCPE